MSARVESATAVGSPRRAISVATRDQGTFRFVVIAWLAMLIAALTLIAIYGSNVPSWDDWDIVPAGDRASIRYLGMAWSQRNEHRVPLPRLLLLAMMRLIRMDFRTGMYFNVVTTTVLALGTHVTRLLGNYLLS